MQHISSEELVRYSVFEIFKVLAVISTYLCERFQPRIHYFLK